MSDELLIKVRVDTSGATKPLKELEDQGSKVAASFSGVGNIFSGISEGFHSVVEAGKGFGEAFAGVREAFAGLSESVAHTAEIFGIGIVVSAGAAAEALRRLEDSSAETAKEMGHLAEVAGTTVEEISGFVSALAGMGVSTSFLESGIKRLAFRVQAVWPEIQKSVEGASDTIVKNNLSVASSFLKVEEAEKSSQRLNQDIANESISNSNSVANATNSVAGSRLSLRDAELKLQELELKRSGFKDPNAQKAIDQSKEELQYEQTKLALQEKSQALANAIQAQRAAEQKEARDAADAPIKRQKAEQAETEARLASRAAQRKRDEDSANSIENLTKYVNNLASGVTDTGLKVNATSSNLIKGIVASVGPGAEVLEGMGTSIGDLGTKAPHLLDVMYKVADIFKGTHDAALNTALAIQLFGRGVSSEFVEALSEGSAALKEEAEHVKHLKLTLSDADKDIGKGFIKSQATLSNHVKLLKDQLGLGLAPVFTEAFEAIDKLLIDNIDHIKAWGKSVVDAVKPAVTAFINVLKGVKFEDFAKTSTLDPEQLLNVKGWMSTIEGIKTGITSLKTVLVTGWYVWTKEILPAIQTVLKGIAGAINAVFGTKISGNELGIAFIIGQFTGLNNIIIKIGGLLIALARLFGLLSIPGALATALVYVVGHLESVQKAAKDVASEINKTFGTDISGSTLVVGLGLLATSILPRIITLAGQAGKALLGLGGATVAGGAAGAAARVAGLGAAGARGAAGAAGAAAAGGVVTRGVVAEVLAEVGILPALLALAGPLVLLTREIKNSREKPKEQRTAENLADIKYTEATDAANAAYRKTVGGAAGLKLGLLPEAERAEAIKTAKAKLDEELKRINGVYAAEIAAARKLGAIKLEETAKEAAEEAYVATLSPEEQKKHKEEKEKHEKEAALPKYGTLGPSPADLAKLQAGEIKSARNVVTIDRAQWKEIGDKAAAAKTGVTDINTPAGKRRIIDIEKNQAYVEEQLRTKGQYTQPEGGAKIVANQRLLQEEEKKKAESKKAEKTEPADKTATALDGVTTSADKLKAAFDALANVAKSAEQTYKEGKSKPGDALTAAEQIAEKATALRKQVEAAPGDNTAIVKSLSIVEQKAIEQATILRKQADVANTKPAEKAIDKGLEKLPTISPLNAAQALPPILPKDVLAQVKTEAAKPSETVVAEKAVEKGLGRIPAPSPPLVPPEDNRALLEHKGGTTPKAILDFLEVLKLPGKLIGGAFAAQPKTTGVLTEEDAFRQNLLDDQRKLETLKLSAYALTRGTAVPGAGEIPGILAMLKHLIPESVPGFVAKHQPEEPTASRPAGTATAELHPASETSAAPTKLFDAAALQPISDSIQQTSTQSTTEITTAIHEPVKIAGGSVTLSDPVKLAGPVELNSKVFAPVTEGLEQLSTKVVAALRELINLFPKKKEENKEDPYKKIFEEGGKYFDHREQPGPLVRTPTEPLPPDTAAGGRFANLPLSTNIEDRRPRDAQGNIIETPESAYDSWGPKFSSLLDRFSARLSEGPSPEQLARDTASGVVPAVGRPAVTGQQNFGFYPQQGGSEPSGFHGTGPGRPVLTFDEVYYNKQTSDKGGPGVSGQSLQTALRDAASSIAAAIQRISQVIPGTVTPAPAAGTPTTAAAVATPIAAAPTTAKSESLAPIAAAIRESGAQETAQLTTAIHDPINVATPIPVSQPVKIDEPVKVDTSSFEPVASGISEANSKLERINTTLEKIVNKDKKKTTDTTSSDLFNRDISITDEDFKRTHNTVTGDSLDERLRKGGTQPSTNIDDRRGLPENAPTPTTPAPAPQTQPAPLPQTQPEPPESEGAGGRFLPSPYQKPFDYREVPLPPVTYQKGEEVSPTEGTQAPRGVGQPPIPQGAPQFERPFEITPEWEEGRRRQFERLNPQGQKPRSELPRFASLEPPTQLPPNLERLNAGIVPVPTPPPLPLERPPVPVQPPYVQPPLSTNIAPTPRARPESAGFDPEAWVKAVFKPEWIRKITSSEGETIGSKTREPVTLHEDLGTAIKSLTDYTKQYIQASGKNPEDLKFTDREDLTNQLLDAVHKNPTQYPKQNPFEGYKRGEGEPFDPLKWAKSILKPQYQTINGKEAPQLDFSKGTQESERARILSEDAKNYQKRTGKTPEDLKFDSYDDLMRQIYGPEAPPAEKNLYKKLPKIPGAAITPQGYGADKLNPPEGIGPPRKEKRSEAEDIDKTQEKVGDLAKPADELGKKLAGLGTAVDSAVPAFEQFGKEGAAAAPAALGAQPVQSPQEIENLRKQNDDAIKNYRAANGPPKVTQQNAPVGLPFPEDDLTAVDRQQIEDRRRENDAAIRNARRPVQDVRDENAAAVGNFYGAQPQQPPPPPLPVQPLQQQPVQPQQAPVADTGALQTLQTNATTAAQAMEGLGTKVEGISFDSIMEPIQSLGSAMGDAASAIAEAAQKISQVSPSSGSSGGDEATSMAGGGLIVGPGTSTSDSIPIAASHNEFVQPAKAVQHYGPGFMESVRTLSFPKFALGGLVKAATHSISEVLPFSGGGDGETVPAALPRFALGGLVLAGGGSSTHIAAAPVLPRFALGGMVQSAMQSVLPGSAPFVAPTGGAGASREGGVGSGLHPVTINLPGGQTLENLYAPGFAVRDMQVASVTNQLGSTGRKPRHYK